MRPLSALAALLAAPLVLVLFIPQPSIAVRDPLSRAIRRYEKVESYSVTLRSEKETGLEVIRYTYRRPGHIRMEFETPHHGTVVTYDPEEKKVRVRPFRSIESLVFVFDPSSSLVKSSRGHRVDESDIGTLLRTARELADHGSVESGEAVKINGRVADVVIVTGRDGSTVENGLVNRYVLYLERTTGLPIKVESFGPEGNLLERVLMDDLKVRMRKEGR